MNKQTKLIICLSIVVILLIGFIWYNYWSSYQQEKYFQIYQEGQINAAITILNEIQNNGYVQLNMGNETITLVQYQG